MTINRAGPGDWDAADLVDNDGHATAIRWFKVVNSSGTAISFPTSSQFPATLGAKTGALSFSITPASDASFPVTGPQTSAEYLANNRAATGALTTVASGVSSVTILASNAGRKGAVITNTDANVLYLDLSGGTASSTSFSVPVAANGVYELPNSPNYTGLITGIWAADGTGSALVTQFT